MQDRSIHACDIPPDPGRACPDWVADEDVAHSNRIIERLKDTARRSPAAAGVRVFASSHTCLPVLQAFQGAGIIVNNGAAGMPNFAGTEYGLATRISLSPHPLALYRTRLGPLHVEAIPIDYDTKAWHCEFLAQWPEGSDAHDSYWRRIRQGPQYGVARAVRT